jgi:hypothetical protein
MRKEVKVHIEKITNGYLFTETGEEDKKRKSFTDSKKNVFDLLLNGGEVKNLLESDSENDIMLEITCYDIESAGSETIENLRDQLVQKEVFDPFKNNQINEVELRLSVNKTNAYSVQRLQSIDFISLDAQLPMSHVRKAEISGMHQATFYANWTTIKKGNPVFASPQARVGMTILAKYYELALGVRSSKKDELDRITDGIKIEIGHLEELFNKRAHIPSNSVEPIILNLKKLIKHD